MHDDAYIGGRSENNINASCMTIWSGRTKQLDIFCRVTGFTSDFLSFIVVEFIRFFHGALHLLDNGHIFRKTVRVNTNWMYWRQRSSWSSVLFRLGGGLFHCFSSLAVAVTIASTHCAYPRRDGQAESARSVASYTAGWFICLSHPTTNRA